MKALNSIISILLLVGLIACKGEVTKSQNLNDVNNQYTGEVKQAVELSDKLLNELSENVIFNGTTDIQRNSFRADLIKIKTRLIQLNNQPTNNDALKDLKTRINRIKSSAILDRDEYFIKPFIDKVDELVKTFSEVQGDVEPPVVFVYDRNFATDGLTDYVQESLGENSDTDNPAEFKIQTYNDRTFAEASGFGAKNTGVVYLISDVIELDEKKYSIQVRQSINFYKDDAKKKKFIQILIGENNDDLSLIKWKELKFETVPEGNANPSVLSEWLKLNEKKGSYRVAFRYQSGVTEEPLSAYPRWQLYTLQIKEND